MFCRLPCDQSVVGNLAARIAAVPECVCGAPCLFDVSRYQGSVNQRRLAASVVGPSNELEARIPVDGVLCSAACRKLLKRMSY
jgi:hypothetical protein